MKYGAAILATLVACKSDKPAEPTKSEPAKTEPAKTEPAKMEPAKTEPAAGVPPKKATTAVSFKLNGTVVNTAPASGDSDEPIMSVNLVNNHGSAAFYGDIAGSPRRAFVTFGVENFKPEPAEYKARAKIHRYLDKSGGKSTGWHSKKDGGTFKITSLVEKEKNPVGTRWLASGTFEAKGLELDLGEQSATTTIDITEGTFTDLEVQTLGKPKP